MEHDKLCPEEICQCDLIDMVREEAARVIEYRAKLLQTGLELTPEVKMVYMDALHESANIVRGADPDIYLKINR